MNTRICYMYRDGSNYKAHGEVIVEGEIVDSQIKRIISRLDEGLYFIPSQVGLDDLQEQLQAWDSPAELDEDARNEDDHPWHELTADDFELTSAQPTRSMTAADLVEAFERVAWDPLDPSLPL